MKSPSTRERRILYTKASPLGDFERTLRSAPDFAVDYFSKTRRPTYDGLLAQLRKALTLQPIRLGRLEHLKLFPARSVELESGLTGRRRVAEARFQFEGSPALWRHDPGLDEAFPYRAVFAITSLGFRGVIDGTDLGPFEAEAKRHASLLKPLLPRLDEPAERFNAMIDPHLQRHAELWFSLDPADVKSLADIPINQQLSDEMRRRARSRPRA